MVSDLAASVKELFALRDKLESYLTGIMTELCPNVLALTGATIGARLLAQAGSLKRLMELPSSTVQLLGAEKALFRHLKNRKNLPPKYGILHEHPLVAKVNKSSRGKAARVLADKISLAARVDFFKGSFVGDRLRKDVEKRIGVAW